MRKYLGLLFAFTLIAASCSGDTDDETKVVGFANILRSGCEFCVNVEDGVQADIGVCAGYEIFAVDHNLDANQMLANADAMITQGVDVYLNFDGGITNYTTTIDEIFAVDHNLDANQMLANADAMITQGVDVYTSRSPTTPPPSAEAGIPMIFIDGAQPPDAPDVYWFGAHGATAGTLMGEYAVNYANENWGGQVDGVFGVWQGNWPDDIKERLASAVGVISQSFPEWTMDTITISDAVLEGEETQAAASAYLNANPDAKNILYLTTTNDIAGLAVVAAMEQLDRLDSGVILSHGGDSNAVAEIRDESSPFIMSIGYFPDRYGEFMLPILEAVLAGETPQRVTFVDHVPVDINNVDEFYPEG